MGFRYYSAFFEKQSVLYKWMFNTQVANCSVISEITAQFFHILRQGSKLRRAQSETRMPSINQGIILSVLTVFAVCNADSLADRFYDKDIPSSLHDSAKLERSKSFDPGKRLIKDLTHVAFQTETEGISYVFTWH